MPKNNRQTGTVTSRQHFRKSHIQFQAIGEGSRGDTFIAKKRAFINGNAETTKALVVVKFNKPGQSADAENSVRREVSVLKKLEGLGCKHPGLISIVDYHVQTDIQWMTTPFLSGGDLHSFTNSFPDALSDPFIWHVVYCVTDALHWLFYGMSPTSPVSSPRWYAFHADLCLPNLLLKPASSDGLFNFPQVVIADFGSAEIYTQSCRRSIRDFVNQQARDLCFFGNYSVNEMAKAANGISGRI